MMTTKVQLVKSSVSRATVRSGRRSGVKTMAAAGRDCWLPGSDFPKRTRFFSWCGCEVGYVGGRAQPPRGTPYLRVSLLAEMKDVLFISG